MVLLPWSTVAEADGEPLEAMPMGLDPTLEDMLDEGLARLKERGTWKLWIWASHTGEQKEFLQAEAFRQYVTVRSV